MPGWTTLAESAPLRWLVSPSHLPPGTSQLRPCPQGGRSGQESTRTGRTPWGLGSEWAGCDFSLTLLADMDLMAHPEAARLPSYVAESVVKNGAMNAVSHLSERSPRRDWEESLI